MPTKPIIVEYLIIVKQEDTFCDSEDAFLRFLDVDSSFTISTQKKSLRSRRKTKQNTRLVLHPAAIWFRLKKKDISN